jgi:hypothetical protein
MRGNKLWGRTALALLISILPEVAYSQDLVLPEGIPVRLRIMHTLSSATAQEGNKIDFHTNDDVSVGGTHRIGQRMLPWRRIIVEMTTCLDIGEHG